MNRLPDSLVLAMHAEYTAGASLSAVARKNQRNRRSLRELFERRGLDIRPAQHGARLPDGRIAPHIPATAAQISALIARATKLRVPREIKHDWRLWSIEKRGKFIARLRAKLASPRDRPDLPFSANVEPFDYASPRAHAIMQKMNEGTDSRTARMKFDICSQGVIWEGSLYFWSPKAGYQSSGPWTPERGRPLLTHIIWERTHGRPVPAGCVVRHIDRNPNNLAPENLALATRNDLVRENQAGALLRRSRAGTALLLERSQTSEGNTHHGITRSLLARRPRK